MKRVSRKYIVHNEAIFLSRSIFKYDNEKFYRKNGHTIIKSEVNPYDADPNVKFIIVRLSDQTLKSVVTDR